jgi:hypothetical protein
LNKPVWEGHTSGRPAKTTFKVITNAFRLGPENFDPVADQRRRIVEKLHGYA